MTTRASGYSVIEVIAPLPLSLDNLSWNAEIPREGGDDATRDVTAYGAFNDPARMDGLAKRFLSHPVDAPSS